MMKTLILSTVLLLFVQLMPLDLFSQSKQVTGSLLKQGMEITSEFIDDKVSIYRNDGIAIVNLQGETVCDGIEAPRKGFSSFFSIEKGVFFAQEEGVVVLKDLSGKQVGVLQFEKFQPFLADNTLVTTTNGGFAYIDLAGNEIVRFDRKKYLAVTQADGNFSASDVFTASAMFLSADDFPPFSEGLTTIKDNATKKIGFINEKFELVIPAQFKQTGRFASGLAAVQDENGNWGYIDKEGKQVIPFSYSRRPADFSSGLSKVTSKAGKLGFINRQNELVIPANYQYATNFYKGYALVKESFNSSPQLIDSTGNVCSEFPKDVSYIDNSAQESSGPFGGEKGEKPFYVSETLRQLVDHGKGIFRKAGYGLLDIDGNIVLEFNYKYLSHYHNGKMLAHASDFTDGATQHTYGIIDDQGQWVLQIVDSEF